MYSMVYNELFTTFIEYIYKLYNELIQCMMILIKGSKKKVTKWE